MGRYADEAELCIRCGFCNSVCPTTLTSIGYAPSRTSRGRLVLLQSALGSGIPDPFSPRFKELIDLCFGCFRCVSVCPAGIPIPSVMAGYRNSYVKRVGLGALSTSERVLAQYDLLVGVVARTPHPIRRALLSRYAMRVFRWMLGLARDAPLPIPEGWILDELFKSPEAHRYGVVYAYFADTFTRLVRPSLGMAVRRLLGRAGIGFVLPPQVDSGIVSWELGLWDRVMRLASANIRALYAEVMRGRGILSSSPASTLMLREVYPELLDCSEGRAVAEAVVDIVELLHELVESGKISAALKGVECMVHSSCLSQHLRLTTPLIDLLEKLGVEVCGVAPECCGLGGVWGLARGNRWLSREVGGRLLSRLRGRGVVVSYSEACSLQISSLARGSVAALLPHQALDMWLMGMVSPPIVQCTSQAQSAGLSRKSRIRL